MCGLVEQYGDIVCVGKGLFFLVWRPEHVEQVLVTRRERYGKGDSIQTARAVFGDGLVTSDGALWRRQRRVIQPAFHQPQLVRLAERLTVETDLMLDRWEQRGDDAGPLDIVPELFTLLQHTIFGMMFSTDVRREAKEMSWAQVVIEEYIDRQAWNPFSWTEKLPTRRNRDVRKALGILEGLFYRLITERRAAGEGPDDLLAALIAARDEQGQPIPDRLIRDEMMTMFFTGHGTITYALAWTWYLVAEHPDVERRMQQEVDALGDRRLTVDDLPNLTYCQQVFEEALRLYPPAWIFARTANETDEIGGYTVPAGMAVLLPTYVTQHHPELWPDPERFDPDRFAPEAVTARHKFAWYPFGGGPRQCVGVEFAYLEALFVLAMITRRFQLRRADTKDVIPKTSTLLKPRDGMLLTPVKRTMSLRE